MVDELWGPINISSFFSSGIRELILVTLVRMMLYDQK